MARITINHITYDPSSNNTVAFAAATPGADAAGSNYVLIQTRAPLTAAQRNELAGLGVRVLEYVPEDTYLSEFTPSDLSSVRALPYVTWANVYLPGFKIAPTLAAGQDSAKIKSLSEMAAQPKRLVSRRPHTIDIVLHNNVKAEDMRQKIAETAHVDPQELRAGAQKIRLTVAERYLPDLAALDEVRHLEPAPVYKLHNNVARQILGFAPPTSPTGDELQGDGQIVAVADTGLDKGSATDVHPAFSGRVLKLYALGRPTASDPDGHGTHVAGSVLGDGTSATLSVRIAGTAPKAKLVLQSVLDSGGGLNGLPTDLHDLFADPYTIDGARVHTNSWGSVVGDGSYDANARELHDFVWEHRDCVICFAAGNEGRDANGDGQIDPNSVTPPGTAKNCITVGASENDRDTFDLTYGEGWPSDFPADPIASDLVADNPDGMVAFSSRGPVQGRRVKPDVVAPGTAILSARSRVTTSKGWALSKDKLYFFEGGTSMATPLVAGCAAVMREYLIKKQQIATPSAALVKAVLINGADDVVGQYIPSEAGTVPNFAEGFGRVNVRTILESGDILLQDEATALDTGEEESVKVQVLAQHKQLKVTLTWTDPPGEALQNDLDLIVSLGGQERHGNVGPGSLDFDNANNVEQVVWNTPPTGEATITVRARRITQFAQPYALVVRLA